MKKKRLTAIIIYIALIILCIAVVYIVPSVKGLLEKTYVTEYGRISIEDEVSAFIVRDETVYVARKDYRIKRLVEHNILTKAGARIVELSRAGKEDEETEELTEENLSDSEAAHKYSGILEDLGKSVQLTRTGRSKQSGYISYFVDGSESKLSTWRLDDLSQADLKKYCNVKSVATPEKKCRKGDPIFKVTSNSKWYLVFYMDNKSAEKYYVGRSVTVKLGGEDVTVKVARNEPGDKTTKVALACKYFYDGFLEERTLKTTITVASAEGLVLRDSSIVEKKGQKGVFVKNKLGEHVFKPISIKADNGENCVAYSDIYVDEGGNFVETIGTYDEIVAEPSEEEIEQLNSEEKKDSKKK